MELFDYVKQSYKTPNPQILKDLGADSKLIEYLRYTPENTNLNVIRAYGGDGGEGGKIAFDAVTIQGQSVVLSTDCTKFQEVLNLAKDGKATPKLNGTGVRRGDQKSVSYSDMPLIYFSAPEAVLFDGGLADMLDDEERNVAVFAMPYGEGGSCVVPIYDYSQGQQDNLFEGHFELTW